MDEEDEPTSQQIANETPTSNVFLPPSIYRAQLLSGESYTHYSPIPSAIIPNETECVLGIDEAGRGPVLGPMVYSLLYLPLSIHRTLLADTYHFDDSKVLTPGVRSNLMRLLCMEGHDLFKNCGWAAEVMSARDISSGMLKRQGTYNLNAQAMDATIGILKGVLDMGVNVKEVYIDTIGSPVVYQKKLERIFPTVSITVAKKADSLYPCVSAASVCAKVTRDAALEVCAEKNGNEGEGWGSGYPSDARCVNWMKGNMDPVFGWGNECRFSWGTAKDMMDAKGSGGVKIDWPVEEDEESMRITDFFSAGASTAIAQDSGMRNWFGTGVGQEVF